MTKRSRIPHPGDILLKEFMEPLEISQNRLARDLHVPPGRINEIVNGMRAISADTDLRLARYFGLSDGYFLRLQVLYDLRETRPQLEKELKRIEPHAA
ncbi:HigA family addiction module antitoxin [Tepidicaulis sp. LMO-SS28]|uniref:HigA family addiction module antitoxin n=1 Tax=Tepidicaulis sp. LMO-SS28 TaxID=3447455 RepID=UPI003EE265FF